jgi:hypothetical protein
MVLILSLLLLLSPAVSYNYTNQSDFTGTFNGTSVDRSQNSGDLGIGYLNGTSGDKITAFYRLDSISSARDYGGSSRDGTVTGGVSSTSGIFSTGGYSFDGSSGYVDIPQNSVPQWWNGEPVSVSAWFKTSGEGMILGNEGGSNPGAGNGWVPSLYVGTG